MTNSQYFVLVREGDVAVYGLHEFGKEIGVRSPRPNPLADADLVVVADYSLLSREDVIEACKSHRFALVQPDTAPRIEAVAERWLLTPLDHRCVLSQQKMLQLQPFLSQRSGILEAHTRQLDTLRARLLEISPLYYEILSAGTGFHAELLAYVREHPSPKRVSTEAVIRLSYALEQSHSVLDGDLATRIREARSQMISDPGWISLAENSISFSASTALLLERQLADLDARIYAAMSPHPYSIAKADLSDSAVIHRDSEPRVSLSSILPRERYEAITKLKTDRFTGERDPLASYERFLGFYRDDLSLTPEELLEVHTVGKLLALDSGNFYSAARHRVRSQRILRELETADAPTDESRRQLLADAVISDALTEALAIHPLKGNGSLRAALTTGGSPALVSEALGLYALTLILLSEIDRHPEVLRTMREAVATAASEGAARAPADIAELFLAAALPSISDEELERLRNRADNHSRGTGYRSWFQWTVMLTSFMTKDVEQGLHAHAEIRREGVWRRYNPHFVRLSRFAYSVHLAARGEFAQAWQEIDAVAQEHELLDDDADMSFYGLIKLRLELAAGNYKPVLAETSFGSRSGAETLRGLHKHRYVPSALMLRGTAFAQDGALDVAHEHFRQATELASITAEWNTLLSFETLEYRAWLESLDRDDLPSKLSTEIYDGLLRRPPFIRHTLPPLTSQHRRVLQLIGQNRSMASIASEMHITANTLKGHVRELYKRIGVTTRRQAALKAADYRY